MKKIISMLIICMLVLSGCSGKKESNKKELMFWTAPNAQQLAHWTDLAKEYNATNPEYTIKVQQMPETPSSEAGIQNAIASGEAPIASENIMRGFAVELANSKAIKDLSKFEEYDSIVKSRNMSEIMTGWEVDGAQYVLPIFSNPMLIKWRTDELKAVGVDKIPTTYKEFLAINDKIKASGADQFTYYGHTITIPENWWERWYDFFIYYNAESGGAEFIKDGKVIADDEAAIKALQLFKDLSEQSNGLLTSESVDALESGTVVGNVSGPWSIPVNKEKYPELVYQKNFDYAMPVNESGKDSKTFADSKGVVIYDKATDEQTKGMLEFFKFAFTDENDLKLLKITNMPPARSDLLENELFASYFKENPEVAVYASHVKDAIPAMADKNFVDIQEKMGERMLKMVKEGVDAKTTWENIKSDIAKVTGK